MIVVMSTTRNITVQIVRRLAAGAALAVAPALIALGAATASHADSGITNGGDNTVSSPVQHGPQRNQDIMRKYLPHTSISHPHKRHYQY